MSRIYFSFVVFLLLACSTTEPCEESDCFIPPPAVIVEIVDPVTGENLFSNGTLIPSDIKLIDRNNKNVDFQFISENSADLLYLKLGWETGNNTYRLVLGPDLVINLSLNSEKNTEGCCSFFVLKDFSILNYTFERSATTGNYTIFVN